MIHIVDRVGRGFCFESEESDVCIDAFVRIRRRVEQVEMAQTG